jgi:CRISPR-associated protein Csb3
MKYPEPTITVNVDVTNPGQFFACCGLLELADRLWPGAEGWFKDTDFHIACAQGLDKLLGALAKADLVSSLTADELKRLGTLLSKEKAALSSPELDEKRRLQGKWRQERLCLSRPFGLWLDWWRDSRGERTAMKTWAAKQLVADMAGKMFAIVREHVAARNGGIPELLFQSGDNSLPFNFDSDLCRTGAARDTGFSADTLGLKSTYRPLLELLAFVGFQRFQPTEARGSFIYCTWGTPLPPPVAAVAASGAISLPTESRYSFSLFNRTKYMKAFLPGNPIQGG